MTAGSVLLGVLLLLGGVLITMMTWLIKTVISHNSALALLIREVTPPNAPSLRVLIDDLRYKVDVSNARDARHDELNYNTGQQHRAQR